MTELRADLWQFINKDWRRREKNINIRVCVCVCVRAEVNYVAILLTNKTLFYQHTHRPRCVRKKIN